MTATDTYDYLAAFGFKRISERKSCIWAETQDVFITESNYAKIENHDAYWEISLTHHTDRKDNIIQMLVKGEFKLRHPCSKFSLVSKKPGLLKLLFKRKMQWQDYFEVAGCPSDKMAPNSNSLYDLRDCHLTIDANQNIRFSFIVETDCTSKLQKLFHFLKEMTSADIPKKPAMN